MPWLHARFKSTILCSCSFFLFPVCGDSCWLMLLANFHFNDLAEIWKPSDGFSVFLWVSQFLISKFVSFIVESGYWNWRCSLIRELLNIYNTIFKYINYILSFNDWFPGMCLILAKCVFQYREVEFIWKGKEVVGNSRTLLLSMLECMTYMRFP